MRVIGSGGGESGTGVGGPRRMRLGSVLAIVLTLVPGLAGACPTCVSSAFGDRTYNWPYLALVLMPFIIVGAIGVILYRHRGERAAADALPSVDSLLNKETT